MVYKELQSNMVKSMAEWRRRAELRASRELRGDHPSRRRRPVMIVIVYCCALLLPVGAPVGAIGRALKLPKGVAHGGAGVPFDPIGGFCRRASVLFLRGETRCIGMADSPARSEIETAAHAAGRGRADALADPCPAKSPAR